MIRAIENIKKWKKEIRYLTLNSPVAQIIEEIRLFLKGLKKLG